jgi:hypothetical protein
MRGTLALLALAAFTLATPAHAYLLHLRDLATADPSLAHHWTFEGGTDAESRADKEGSADLARVTKGGSAPATFVGGYQGEGLCARTHRTAHTVGSAYLSSAFAMPNAGTIEFLFQALGDPASGHILSTNNNWTRSYFAIDDPDDAASVAFGGGSWPDPRTEFLTDATAPDHEYGHWYYTAIAYSRSGGTLTADVYVADLTERQATLSQTLTAATWSVPAANPSSRPFGIGLQDNQANFFGGLIDELAVYGAPLSADALQSHLDAVYVPEPATLGLLGLGALVLARRRRR